MLTIKREENIIDAAGIPLGRLASQIAIRLMGKHKISYRTNRDDGDFVVIKNLRKIRFTGQKVNQKVYYRHSQYPGGLKTRLLKDFFQQAPEEVVRKAVYNMLPNNTFRKNRLKRLRFMQDK